MKQQLNDIRVQALSAFEAAADLAALDALRVQYLGKKGELTAVLKQMGKLSAEERPVMGQLANQVRADLEGMQTMRTLGRNMAWLLRCIEAGRAAGVPAPEQEARVRTNFIR